MHKRFFCGAALALTTTLPAILHAQALNYSTSWIGNTFGGGEKWVQNFIDNLYVAPDGTVYTASGWDEAGREFGIYKNGDAIGRAADTHGWGTGGGYAVTANDQYMWIAHSHGNEGGGLKGEPYPPKGFTWFGISRRAKDGKPAPFPGGRGRFGDMLVLHELGEKQDGQVRGLAVDAQNRLYASDPVAGAIRVFDGNTMQPLRSWEVLRPRQIVLDHQSTLWVLQDDPGKTSRPRIKRYTSEGKALPQEIDVSKLTPTAIGFDRKNHRLLVADGGTTQQIHLWRNLDSKPVPAGTFGVAGGILGGKVRGQNAPDKLPGPKGVGTDAQGNLYVGCDQPAGGAVLRAFAPDGRGSWKNLQWEVLGLEFVDGADVNPASNGTDVWTTENRYTLDWDKPTGKQWSWRSQTVDPVRFPNDPRLHEGHHDFTTPLYRRLNGRPFLVVRGMFQHALVIYKIDGEIAKPSVMFAKGPYRNGNWQNIAQPEQGRWMWRDINGDGDFQKEEFLDADGVRDPESWAWWFDENGGIWQGDQNADAGNGNKPIKYFALQGLDKQGNLIYSRAAMRSWELPAPMNHLLRIEYLPQSDTMYLTGHTTERPKTGGEWGQVGSEVWRIDGWMKGNRTPKYRIALPYSPEVGASAPGVSVPNVTIKSFCVAGDYAFAVESRTAKVHVYNANSGEKVGEMTPGPEVGKESGWVDYPDAMRAFKRRNGEYLVFVEEDAKAKIIVYRWRPATQA